MYATNTQTSTITLIANMLVSSNSYTSNSWLWTPSTNLYVGNTLFFANVVMTDANPTTVNSVANDFGYNAIFLVGTPTESNSVIDAGQYTLQTANPSQGTAPYVSYQWYTISGSTAPTCTVSNAISGATSSTCLANPATTNSYAYEVSDSASTANTACSSGDTATVDTVPTVTITAQNTIVDAGQYVSFSATPSGGSGTFGTYNFIVFNSISNTVLANQLSSSSTFSFPTNSQWTTNSPIQANVIVTDTGTTTHYAFNSPELTTSITVDSALATPTITPASPITLDAGQSNTIFAYESGGSGIYSYNFLIVNAISGNVLGNLITTSNSYAFTTNAQWTTDNSPLIANVIVTDTGTSSPAIANSVNSAKITVDSALTTPTITPAAPITLDAGQSNTIFAYESGGSGTYSYNFLIVNAISGNVLGNLITTSNSYAFTTNAQWTTDNSPLIANVIVTDTGTSSPAIANSVNSAKITVDSALTTPTITPAAPITLDAGQSNTIFAYESGGSGTYSYNFLIVNAISGNVLGNLITTSNSYTFTTNAQWTTDNSPLIANVIVTDTGTTSPAIANSVNSAKITVDSTPTVSITAQNTIVRRRAVRIVLSNTLRRIRDIRNLQLHSIQLRGLHGDRKPVVFILNVRLRHKLPMVNRLPMSGECNSN